MCPALKIKIVFIIKGRQDSDGNWMVAGLDMVECISEEKS